MTRIGPEKITIAVATCRRPQGIRKLLNSIDALSFDTARYDLRVIVVDNAPDAQAFSGSDAAQAHSRWPLVYAVEPDPGIVMARNKALDLALPDADWISFVDDDETVTENWLSALFDTQRGFDADVVQGPVEPIFSAEPPHWALELNLFRRGPFSEGQERRSAATNNVLVRADLLRRHGFRFNSAFNSSGGEDEELFGRLHAFEARIVCSAHALVFEDIPPERISFRWAMRRSFRKGNTLGRIARLRRRGRASRIGKGLAAFARGVIWGIVGSRSAAGRLRGAMEACRGAGMLLAFLRLKVREYDTSLVSWDDDLLVVRSL